MKGVAGPDFSGSTWHDSDDEHEHEPPSGCSSSMDALAAIHTTPHIPVLNANNSKIHIGTRVVHNSVNVHNTEVIKGRLLWLDLEASVGGRGKIRAHRLRCSVAVFVCWALMVATGLVLYLLWHYVLAERHERLDIGITEPWYLRRADWQANRAYGTLTLLDLPVQYALVGHSVTSCCMERYNCTVEVLTMQREQQRWGWDDIGSNFLVSGNGLVFEGRGANVVGDMVRKRMWNSRSVSIMFLGDYRSGHNSPTAVQLQRTAALLAALVRDGVLHPQYTLLGHCQVAPWTYTPGQQVMEKLKTFEHWSDVNATFCLTS